MTDRVRVQIIFYSMYGHVYRMAEAVAEGARSVPGADVRLFQVPELVPADVLERSGAAAAKKAFAHVPVASVDQMGDADAILFGTPTRYGNMCAQMRNFLDQTGGLWMKNALVERSAACSCPRRPSMAGRRPPSPASTRRCSTSGWSS